MHATTEAILHCRLSHWLETFRHLCYPRELLSLPEDFVKYLVSDGVFVQGDTQLFGGARDDECDSDTSSSTSSQRQEQEFPELTKQIEDLIAKLGGKVVPKLTWSAPRDAIWLSPEKTLKCYCAEEVVLFLKSSDRVAHDICTPFDAPCQSSETVDHHLCLSKYYDLLPQYEFRCFVKHDRMVGISQRDITQFFPQLVNEESRIRELCQSWFETNIKSRFTLKQYSLDVYITRKERVKLLDINAICFSSSSLLFSWEELGLDPDDQEPTHSEHEGDIPVKFVCDDGSFMMGSTLAVSMPYDMVGCSLTEALEKMQSSVQGKD